MTEDKLLHLGMTSRVFLESDSFNELVSLLRQEITERILLTEPEETAKREQNYYLHKAVEELMGLMKTSVDQSDAILKSQEEQSQAEPLDAED